MSRRYDVFTYHHGDTVFTTRFQFVARLAARFVRTLDCLPEGMERGTALAAGLVPPEGMEATLDHTFWAWWPVGTEKAYGVTSCRFCESPAMLLTHQFEPVCASHYEEQEEYNPATCPDCGHDYYHDALGRCMYPMDSGDEARVCGWHPDVLGPVPCETRVETPESLEAGRMCYAGRCSRCYGEGCPEYWAGFKKAEREHLQEIREHDCEKSGCGPVCTAFES